MNALSPLTTLPTPVLPLARYRLHFTALTDVSLPAYAGSAWRGAFGHALKKLVCITRQPTCPNCLLYRSCVYPYLFETPPDPQVGKLTRYTAAPHPLVFLPLNNGPQPAGATVCLQLTLFGHGNRYLAYILHALQQATERGIGTGDGRLTLTHIEQETPTGWSRIHHTNGPITPQPTGMPHPPPCPQRLRLSITTPLRLTRQGHLVTPATFDFASLFASLLRRVSLLTAFHTDTALETDFRFLSDAAQAYSGLTARLNWQSWTRYSTRQNRPIQMDGLSGTAVLDGRGLEPFWPYLWLGQWTHVGKGAVMGLGSYQLDTH